MNINIWLRYSECEFWILTLDHLLLIILIWFITQAVIDPWPYLKFLSGARDVTVRKAGEVLSLTEQREDKDIIKQMNQQDCFRWW